MVVAKRIKTDPVDAELTRVPKMPGEFRYETLDYKPCEPPAGDEPFRLNMACVMGHGNCGSIIIGRKKPEHPTGHTWEWDGNVEHPTLKPSINCLAVGPSGEKYGGCGWHAWLTAGEFK